MRSLSLIFPLLFSAEFSVARPLPPDPPSVCSCPPAVTARISQYVSAAASTRVVQCSQKQPQGCSQDVTVQKNKDGSCLVTLDYCVLCVRVNDTNSPRPHFPKMTWTLKEGGATSNDFVFAANKGIDIPKADAGGKDHFHGAGHGGSRAKFKWLTGPDPSLGLDHWPVVFPKVVTPDTKACDLKDPIIVNTDQ